MAADAAEALDRIEEPRLAADRQVEAAVAVGHDVEPGSLLRIDDRRDGVEVLLAEQRVAERRLERPPGKARVEPKGARIGPGDRSGQQQVTRALQHRSVL